jgi:hypothetical protein
MRRTELIAMALACTLLAGARGTWAGEDAGCGQVMLDSLAGDVYGHPERWRPLSLGTFFTEGWDQAWVSPPTGEGGAPRQGWLNAEDGVFYRLGIGTMGWAKNFLGGGDQYTGGTTLYLPLNQRFEFRVDVPIIVSNDGRSGTDRSVTGGDFQVTPRFLLGETRDFTHSLDVTLRTPTGDTENYQGIAAVAPKYNFWWNAWRGMVVRGGVGGFFPYNHDGTREVGARQTFNSNLALGYYLTPHEMAPIGDLVFYASANLAQFMNGPSNTTTFTITPGFRSHLGHDFYLLGGVEVPVTSPEPYDYQVLGGLMKVF